MVKNKHLLIGIASTSLITVLICLVVLIRENTNGQGLLNQAHDVQELNSKLSVLSKDSQEMRQNLEHLQDRKIPKSTAEMIQMIDSQKQEAKRLEKELTALKGENKRLQDEFGKELNLLKMENKRLQDEISSGNGIRKKLDDLEKAVKKLETNSPSEK